VKAVLRDRGRNYITPTVTAVGTTETEFTVMITSTITAGFFQSELDDIEGSRITSSPMQLFNRRQPRISLARISGLAKV